MENTFTTIEEYIAGCPAQRRELLEALRRTIREAAPDAREKISWGMPTFTLKGNLVHFALHARHVGFYPGASGVEAFADRFRALKLKMSKGAVQFPLGEPLPLDLVAEVVRFRAAENSANL